MFNRSLKPQRPLHKNTMWLIGAWLFVFAQAASAQPVATPVLAAKPQLKVMQEDIVLTGTLQANEQVMVSSEIAGTVKSISFDEGGSIDANAQILMLDDSLLAAELQQSQASFKLAKTRYDRAQQLLKSKSISQSSYDESAAELAERSAALEVAKVRLDQTRIKAPFGGAIAFRNVSIGAYVKPGDHLVTIIDDTPLKLHFRVPERLASAVTPGSTIHFEVASGNKAKHYQAAISAVEPLIANKSRTLLARAIFANDNQEIIAGAFAKIHLLIGATEPVITIPAEAVIGTRSGQKVFVVNDGKAESRSIVTGVRKNGLISVLEGLADQPEVIIAGHQLIGDGSPIVVRSDG